MQQLQIRQRHEPRAAQEQVRLRAPAAAWRAAWLAARSCAPSRLPAALLPPCPARTPNTCTLITTAPLLTRPQLEAAYVAASKAKNPKRPLGFERLPEAAPPTTNMLLDFKGRKGKKRCALGGWAPVQLLFVACVGKGWRRSKVCVKRSSRCSPLLLPCHLPARPAQQAIWRGGAAPRGEPPAAAAAGPAGGHAVCGGAARPSQPLPGGWPGPGGACAAAQAASGGRRQVRLTRVGWPAGAVGARSCSPSCRWPPAAHAPLLSLHSPSPVPTHTNPTHPRPHPHPPLPAAASGSRASGAAAGSSSTAAAR